MYNYYENTLVRKLRFYFQEFSPPPYNEIGKKSHDLFNSGYYFGALTLDVKTRSNNVEIGTSWTENMEENKLYGSVEVKYHLADHNLAITERLNKNCFLHTELCYKNKLLNGLALTFGGTFSPRNGLKTGLLKAEYANRFCSITSDFEIGKNFSLNTSSCVFGYRGVFGGIQWRYDVRNEKKEDLNFTVGYSKDFYIHTYVNNGYECGGSVCHKVEPNLEVGLDIKWWTKNPEPLYGVAARYELSKDVNVRGKINNIGELGFSYEQKLSEDIKLTTSTFFDLKNVGKHKFGLGLQLEL